MPIHSIIALYHSRKQSGQVKGFYRVTAFGTIPFQVNTMFTVKTKAKMVVARVKFIGFRLFLVSLGVVIGGSGVFVYLSLPSILEPQIMTFQNVSTFQRVEAKEEKKVETVEETIRRVAGDFPEVETLVKVAFCESSFNRLAENKVSSAKGVFQILDMHGLSAVERFDVEKSTRWAVDTIEKQGFKPWNASKHCWSK